MADRRADPQRVEAEQSSRVNLPGRGCAGSGSIGSGLVRQRYLTLVVDHDNRRLWWAMPGRDVRPFARSLPR